MTDKERIVQLEADNARLREDLDGLATEAQRLAAERTFILGKDIPETLERARAVLVQKVYDAEARARQVEQERYDERYDTAHAINHAYTRAQQAEAQLSTLTASQGRLEQAAVYELVHDSMGIYPASIHEKGIETKRTEWQDGWNAYGMQFIERVCRASDWLKTLTAEQRRALFSLVADQVVWARIVGGEPIRLLTTGDDSRDVEPSELVALAATPQETT